MANHFPTPIRLLNQRLADLMLLVIFAVLVLSSISCSSTKVTSFSNSKSTPQTQVTSIVTVMLDPRSYVRAAVEGHLADQLKEHGVQAYPSYTKVSLEGVEGNMDKLRQDLSAWNADAVLICKLTDRADITEPPEFQSKGGDWKQVWATESDHSTGFEMNTWGGDVTVNLHMECKLFQLSDEQLLWVGYAEARLGETTDDVKRIQAISSQVVTQLQKDGLIK